MIQQYLEELRTNENKNPFLLWTETDVQSYLYHRLVSDPQIEKAFAVLNRPVLSSVNPDKKYKGKAKNVKPFYQPDLLITPLKNLQIEKRKNKPRLERRIKLLRKDDSIIVEIKFVQDTNDSTGRKSVTKLTELAEDYKKNRTEGHKHIILVFVEKGDESYLSKGDINRMSRYQDALVMYKPKKSLFDQLGPKKT